MPDIGADGLDLVARGRFGPLSLVLAWGELERDMPGRLRPCANDECRLFLIDRSRAGIGPLVLDDAGCGNTDEARAATTAGHARKD